MTLRCLIHRQYSVFLEDKQLQQLQQLITLIKKAAYCGLLILLERINQNHGFISVRTGRDNINRRF